MGWVRMNLLATIQAFEQIPRADAVAQFQLLQSVEQVLAASEQKAVNEVLSSMEEAFVPVVLGGTSPPVRRAVAGCFQIACRKVATPRRLCALTVVVHHLTQKVLASSRGRVAPSST